MIGAPYRFVDHVVDVAFPPAIQEAWDLLYGRLAVPHGDDPTASSIRLAVEPDPASGRTVITAGGLRRVTDAGTEMIHLQDIVQNHLLTSVRSRLLWHGACWDIGGRGVMVLADSGAGKTTLSLALHSAGGRVLSDEIAALNPASRLLEPFPRAIAARPDSLAVCGVKDTYPHLRLDEEKVMIPLPAITGDGGGAVPLRAVIFLAWQPDPDGPDGAVAELHVVAPDGTWRAELESRSEGMRIEPHPDGTGWWQCRSPQPVKSAVFEEALTGAGASLAGFHRGAFRMPDFGGDPRMGPLERQEAVMASLGHLLNARSLAAAGDPSRLAGAVHAAFGGVKAFRCVPGRLSDTLEAMIKAVRS